MTAEQPAFAGPPCDICGDEYAALSLLNYADYAQIKAGVNCAPDFLRSIADSMDGRHTAGPPAVAELAAELAAASPDPVGDVLDAQGAPAEPEQGSAKDHWASTTSVRRSTHGHRATTRKPAAPRKDEPQ